MIYEVGREMKQAKIVELARAVPLPDLKRVVDEMATLLDTMLETAEATATSAGGDNSRLDALLKELDKANDNYQTVWKVLQERRGRGEK